MKVILLTMFLLAGTLISCTKVEPEEVGYDLRTILEGSWRASGETGVLATCTSQVLFSENGSFRFRVALGLSHENGEYPFGVCATNYLGSYRIDSTQNKNEFYLYLKPDSISDCRRCSLQREPIKYCCSKFRNETLEYQYEVIVKSQKWITVNVPSFLYGGGLPNIFVPYELRKTSEAGLPER